jgi:head-tail adaptor
VTVLGDPGAPVPDGAGGHTENRPTLARRWADIESASAADVERRSQVQVQGQITHFVTFDYVAGVTVQSQIVKGSRVFHVKGIDNPEEKNIDLVLACEERA